MKYAIEKNRKWLCKISAAVAGLFCTALLALVIPAKEVLAQTECTVTASSANIRASADTGSTALASVLKGDKLTVTEEVTGADGKVWYKVIIDANSQGYVRSDLVSKEGGGQTTTITESATTSPSTDGGSSQPALNMNVTVNTDGMEAVQPVGASVTKDQVRVRADSSTNSSIVTSAKKDVALTVHGTKAGSGSEVWYYVSFVVDGTEVKGYIRSDFVSLNGELLPVSQEPETPPEEPGEVPPEEPVVTPKDYETEQSDGAWWLVDNVGLHKYKIDELFSISAQNAEDLEKAEKKMSRQTGIIVFLSILMVLLVLGITLLIFKIKDMMEDDGLDERTVRQRPAGDRVRGQSGSAGRRPVGTRPGTAGSTGRPAGARSASTGSTGRPVGTRPASAGSTGRPTGTRPAATGSAGRPVAPGSAARPAGTRPAAAGGTGRPVGTRPGAPGSAGRPVGTRPVSQADREGTIERQTRAHVENRSLERKTAESQGRKPRNFMADDDEFEFEFLNWDGDET